MVKAGHALVTLGLILLVVGSFAGRWHGAGDALAVARPVLALALGLWLLPRMAPLWGVMPGLVLAGFALVSVAVPFVQAPAPRTGPGAVVIYQKNLSFRLTDPGPLIADIRASAPDVITLQEVTPALQVAVMQALADAYPTQGFCPFARVGGTAVLARWPAAGPVVCPAARGATVLPLALPQGRVTAVSLHLHWPFPHGQRAQLDALRPDLAALTGPVLVGGDFNMVPWGWPLVAVGAATRTLRAGPALASFHIGRWLPMAIDHVLAPGGGAVAARPRLGSDHLGLLARVRL